MLHYLRLPKVRGVPIALVMALVLVGCSTAAPAAEPETGEADGDDSVFFVYELQQVVENSITISTDATSPTTGFLDKIHTCEGADTSPPLRWEGVPAETKSLALILDDPASDELKGFGLWTHWVLYSIPPGVTELQIGQPTTEVFENGAVHGMNGYEKAQYSGPCPTPTIMWSESIERRTPPLLAKDRPYFFKLYAIDKEIDLGLGVTRNALLREIDGHVIAAGELAVLYKSKRKEVRSGREYSSG